MRAALLCLAAILSGAPAAFAQSGTGEIWGHVAAGDGNAIAGANVTARNIDTAAEQTTRTDSGGRFGFARLPPGRYEVTALHDRFATRRQEDVVLLRDALRAISPTCPISGRRSTTCLARPGR